MGVSVCAAISPSLGIGGTEGPSAAQEVEVGGVDIVEDDEADRFVGSGAVFLPSSVSASRRQQAAWCHGCRWKVTTPCLREDEHIDARCRGGVLGGPQGREIGRAWLACPGADFEPVGLFCPHDGEVTSVADMSTGIRGDIVGKVRCWPRNVYRRGVQWWASTCTADRANHPLGSDGPPRWLAMRSWARRARRASGPLSRRLQRA